MGEVILALHALHTLQSGHRCIELGRRQDEWKMLLQLRHAVLLDGSVRSLHLQQRLVLWKAGSAVERAIARIGGSGEVGSMELLGSMELELMLWHIVFNLFYILSIHILLILLFVLLILLFVLLMLLLLKINLVSLAVDAPDPDQKCKVPVLHCPHASIG